MNNDHPLKHSNNADQNDHPLSYSTVQMRDECCVVSWRCKWIGVKWIIWRTLKCKMVKVWLGYTSELEWYGLCNVQWEKWIMDAILWFGDAGGLELNELCSMLYMRWVLCLCLGGARAMVWQKCSGDDLWHIIRYSPPAVETVRYKYSGTLQIRWWPALIE